MLRSRPTRPRWLPRSLAGRGGLLLLFVAVTIGLPAVIVYRSFAAIQSDRQARALAALTRAALSDHLQRQIHPFDARETIATLNAAGQPRLHWAAIIDPNGQPIDHNWSDLVGETGLPVEEVLAQVNAAGGFTQHRLNAPTGASGRFELITLPQRHGYKLAAVVDLGESPPAATIPWLAILGATAGALIAQAIAVRFLRFALLRPIRQVTQRVDDLKAELVELTPPADVPVELERLYRSVESTERELTQWRVRATHLQNALDDKVQDKTRQVERELEAAQRQAGTDALTRLGNRRALERDMPPLFARHVERHEDLAFIMFDVNNFKLFNDTHGHQRGDEVLGFVGELLKSCSRRGTDIAVRYGGDEFVLVLPGTPLGPAVEVATRITQLFGQRARTFAPLARPLGISAGVATLGAHQPDTPATLLKMADTAMYLAKRTQHHVATYTDVRDVTSRPPQAQGR